MKRIKRGFTVFELIIVIAVIAALSAVLVPSFIGLTAKTKLAQDKALLNNLNNALVISKKGGNKKVKTMHEAVLAVKRGGYTTDKLVTASGEDLVFSVADNQFHLSSEIEVGKEHECFKMYDSMPEYTEGDRHWSIYAKEGFATEEISNLTVGFDVGYNKNIKYITYVGEKDVVINTFNGVLTINSSAGKVSHYGIAQTVDILEVSNNSYFEEGTTTFLRLNKGRVVVTPAASIGGIHILENGDVYDSIKIGVIDDTPLPTISRDQVSEDIKTTSGTYTKYIGELQNLNDRDDAEPIIEHIWLQVVVANSTPTSSAIISTDGEEISEKNESEITEQGKEACLFLNEAMSVSESEDEAYASVETEVPEGAVARTGLIYFNSLQEAFDRVANKGKVTMVANYTVTENIATDKNFILDLKGRTITMTTHSISIDGGNFTLIDSGSGGKITGTSGIGIVATNSVITINSGQVITTSATATLHLTGCEFYLKGGTIKGKNSVVLLEEIISCDLTGGTIQSTTGTSSSYALYHKTQTENTDVVVTIRGNTQIIGKAGYAVFGKNLDISENPNISSTSRYSLRLNGVTNISGGTINSPNSNTIVLYSGAILNVTGGTITCKSSSKRFVLAEKYTGLINAKTGHAYITDANITHYAKVYDSDDTTLAYYGTAYGAPRTSTCKNKIVRFVKDITLTGSQYFYVSSNMTIDLNGHNITHTNDETMTAKYLIRITAPNVTIKGDGVCSYTEIDSLNSATTYLILVTLSSTSTINIEGGTYLFSSKVANRRMIYVSKVSSTSKFYFKGGTFGSSDYTTNKFISISTSDSNYAKRESFIFSGGSYYGFDPANHGTSYKISLASGYSSALNSETGYYEVTKD